MRGQGYIYVAWGWEEEEKVWDMGPKGTNGANLEGVFGATVACRGFKWYILWYILSKIYLLRNIWPEFFLLPSELYSTERVMRLERERERARSIISTWMAFCRMQEKNKFDKIQMIVVIFFLCLPLPFQAPITEWPKYSHLR